MKVCMVIGSLSSGGAERVAATLANFWSARGEKVTVITVAGRDEDFYSLNPAVKHISLDMAGESSNAFSGLWNNVKRVWALRKSLKRERPSITLGFMPTANILCGLAVWGTGLTAAGSEHIHPPTMLPSKLWRALRRAVYPRLAFVSALTEESARWLKTYTGVHKVPVIPNPVAYPLSVQEPKVGPASLRSRSGGEEHWLLAVGRLTEEKGFDRLLDAFSRIAPEHPAWRLIVLGEGPLRSELEKQTVDLDLERQVVFPGAVGNIGDWYEAADGYVMTSRFEGFGNTLAEALAYGMPSIAVDCETGPRHIIRHELDGLLIPQNDQTALISALRRLMSDDALRSRLGTYAVEARQRFSVEKIAAMWEAQFEPYMGR